MQNVNCRSIVSSESLWIIAIEFIARIDRNQIDYNLKLAFIVYKFAKIAGIRGAKLRNLVFLACFYNVGKLYSKDGDGDPVFETYLFLKYFSPLNVFAEVLLKNSKHPMSAKFLICKYYTDELISTKNKNEALKNVLEHYKDDFVGIDRLALKKLVAKTDFYYEINSLHYKSEVFGVISKMMFGLFERNNFLIMLSSLFEMYSSQTLNHSKSTALIAYTLAKLLKLPKERQKNIYVAGLCHDLGKVNIPLKILEKDDKLTEQEYAKMKRHVSYTKEILTNKISIEIIEIAYRHHERLDGSGYPNKLKGDEMTIDQKILQVADVTSALIMKRSYKEAFGWDKCISILEKEVENGKFDKDIVECLKNNKNTITKVSNKILSETDKTYSKIKKEREKFYPKKI